MIFHPQPLFEFVLIRVNWWLFLFPCPESIINYQLSIINTKPAPSILPIAASPIPPTLPPPTLFCPFLCVPARGPWGLVPLWLCPNYAKRTQFPEPQNCRNLLCRKDLRRFSAPPPSKKQSQSNPTCRGEAPLGRGEAGFPLRSTQYEIRFTRYTSRLPPGGFTKHQFQVTTVRLS